jgi:hypothetical protein
LYDYDIVLYELITSKANIEFENEEAEINSTIQPNNPKNYRKRLKTDIYSPITEKLAADLGLSCQLNINFRQPNFYIADLDAEVI